MSHSDIPTAVFSLAVFCGKEGSADVGYGRYPIFSTCTKAKNVPFKRENRISGKSHFYLVCVRGKVTKKREIFGNGPNNSFFYLAQKDDQFTNALWPNGGEHNGNIFVFSVVRITIKKLSLSRFYLVAQRETGVSEGGGTKRKFYFLEGKIIYRFFSPGNSYPSM